MTGKVLFVQSKIHFCSSNQSTLLMIKYTSINWVVKLTLVMLNNQTEDSLKKSLKIVQIRHGCNMGNSSII